MHTFPLKYTMKNLIKMLLLSSATACALSGAAAVRPEIHALPSGTYIERLSNNGLWGLSQNGGETEDGLKYSAGGSIWNITSMTSAPVDLPSSGRASVMDITDDGSIVVGSCNDRPAYYITATRQWVTLPLPDSTIGGGLTAVTPDGTKAVGYANITSDWDARPVFYDLTTRRLIELPAIPVKDMHHDVSELVRFCDISADGRYILGRMSEQMLLPISMCAFIYDTQTDKVSYIAFTPDDNKPWTPHYRNCAFIDYVTMSPDGRYVSGQAYITNEIEGSEFLDEYYVAFRYDVATGESEIFDGPYDSDSSGFSISNDGRVYAAVPANNPYASMIVRHGQYYYPLDEVFSQAYGMDFEALTDMPVTGKPLSVSNDGKVLAMITGTDRGYILKMNEEWADAVGRVNLLNRFSAMPANGSVFTTLSKVRLTFSRNIDLSGAASRIKLLDNTGKTVQSALSAEVSNATLTINFRPTILENGRSYTVNIPAGFVTMQGNAMMAADKIELKYTGRNDGPVAVQSVQPADGATFARLDATTNRIYLTFDASVAVADGAKAHLRRKGETTPVADLTVAIAAPSAVALYPASRQYLYDGTDYEVVIPAGSVTDLSGAGANEEIIIGYSGNYVREVSADDKYLFADDCDNYLGFMFFDGDRLEPAAAPAGWGFTADEPWKIVRENEEATDMALAAHSMFANGGKADDWAVTPQLFIPDAGCYLSFDAQSYLMNKTDRLKVYAYASDNGYSSLNRELVDDMRKNGKLIFNGQLTPGQSEEAFTGDWQTYVVKLDEFAHKYIYLAFVNDNENQSAIFINHVEVVHDMSFLTSITSASTVVDLQGAPVEGVITNVSDLLVINSLDLVLKDSSGATVSQLSQSGLNITKGQTYQFSFKQPLPLEAGRINRYSIEITVNNADKTTVNGSIKNMVFRTTRQVVVEEFSGRDCSNCPRGFKAMENLERIYPGGIVPIVIRTYESDPLGAGLTSYSDFLGLNLLGAPSAMINRVAACYPTYSVGNDFHFSGQGLAEEGGEDPVCWLDAVNAEMQTLPDADLTFSATYNAEAGNIEVDGNVRFAINTSRNVNIFNVLLENDVPTTQLNGMRYYDDPDLGEWGKGGMYDAREVSLNIDHVARATYGTTFNGTPGMIPFVQTADNENPFSFTLTMPESVADTGKTELAVILIDADTDAVINAAVKPVINPDSAIAEIESGAGNSPAEYFDMQGRRVARPSKGQLLIRRQGTKTDKIIF